MTPTTPWADALLKKPAISLRSKDSLVTPTRLGRLSTPGTPTKSWLRHWMIADLHLNSLQWFYNQGNFSVDNLKTPVNPSESFEYRCV